MDNLNEIASEVRIIDHQDISNAEQVVVVKSVNLIEVTNINLENEYPKASGELVTDIGLPPTEDELSSLEADIKRGIGKLGMLSACTCVPANCTHSLVTSEVGVIGCQFDHGT